MWLCSSSTSIIEDRDLSAHLNILTIRQRLNSLSLPAYSAWSSCAGLRSLDHLHLHRQRTVIAPPEPDLKRYPLPHRQRLLARTIARRQRHWPRSFRITRRIPSWRLAPPGIDSVRLAGFAIREYRTQSEECVYRSTPITSNRFAIREYKTQSEECVQVSQYFHYF